MDAPPTYGRARRRAIVALLGFCLLFLGAAETAQAATGDIFAFAGNGTSGNAGDGGAATSATMISPIGIARAANGDVYVVDNTANVVRKITSAGIISTVAGTGTAGFAGDGGQATAAQLNAPRDVALDAAGNLYISDSGNARIRRVGTDGVISTIAGTGAVGLAGDGGQATAATLNNPRGMAFDAAGNLYFADYNNTVRKISPGGVISNVAGTGVAGSAGDGGQATSATLNRPVDVAVDSSGNVYIAEFSGYRIRKVAPDGTISTFAGTGMNTSTGDGGSATAATLAEPSEIALDSKGDLYVSEYTGQVVRKISGGIITRIAGTRSAGNTGDNGSGTSATVNSPVGLAVTATGDLLLADLANHRVRRIAAVSPPDPPTITSTNPASPASNNAVKVIGSTVSGSMVQLYTDSSCSVPIGPSSTAATFTGAGIGVTVTADATTTFWAKASLNGLPSICSTSSISYTEDSTAPVPPTLTASPPSSGNSRSPSWSFTDEAGATFECELKAGTVISAWSACTSPRAYDLTGKSDAVYQFSVRATDAANNRGTATVTTYTLDTAAPAAPSVTAPAATSGNAPSWSFSGEGGGTYQCQLDQAGTVIYAWAACTSAKSYSLSGKPDGVYTFSVKQTDAAGNVGATATSTYNYDSVAPLAPTVTAAAATSGNAPSWSFTGSEGGGSYQCQLDQAGTVIYAWAACTSAKSYSLSGKPDGVYTFSVKQTDAAGNVGAVATSNYTYDTVAPSQPSVTGPAATSGAAPSWSFSGEFGGTYSCQVDRGGTIISAYASCTSPQSYSLSAQPDGVYTLSVKQIDAAGNASTAATSNYTLDTAAPVAPTISTSPGTPDNDSAPAWSFSGEPGAALECRIERGGTQVYDWATCTSGQTFDLGLQPDGAYTLKVRARDAAGNAGAVATSGAYTLDRSAPTGPTISSTPGVTGSATNPAWHFSGEPGATLECRLDRGGTQIDDWVGCSTSKSYDLSAEVDGVYTFSVRATDAAGNVGDVSTSDYTLDRVAPVQPTVTTAPASPDNDTAPSWSFSTELGATTECRLDRGATQIADWAPCTSTRSYNLSAEIDGTYTFSVRATDGAGNQGNPKTSSYTLDRAAPSPPSIDTPPVSPGNDTTPTWAFSSEAGATFECKLTRAGTLVSDWAACATGATYDLSSEPDGTYTLAVRATDVAGNTGSAQTSDYVLDTTAPAAAAITVSPPSPGNDTTPQWSFGGGSGGSGFECRLDRGATPVSGWSSCSSPAGFDLSAEPDGTYTFQVRAFDAAGNRGSADSTDFVLDTTVPATATIGTTPGVTGSTRAVSWSFSGDPGENFECRLRQGATIVSDWNTCVSPRAYSLSGEPDGSYTFEVRGVAAGGTRGAADSDNYILDTAAPAAPSVDSPPPTIGNTRSATWGFSAEPGAQVECRLDRDGTQVIAWSSCSSPYVADLSGGADGAYTLRLRATDAAGNTGTEGSAAYTLDTLAPPAPAVDAPPAPVGNDAQPSFGFAAQSGLTYECRLIGAVDWQSCTTPRSYDLNALPDGSYTFEVRAHDSAGNVSPAGSAAYELDRAPAGVLLGATPGPIGNSRSPSWAFGGESGATFECSLSSGGATVFDWALCTSPRTYDLSGRSDGAYVFAVRARDRAGNLGSPVTQSYTLDSVVPSKPVLKSTPATPSRDRSPTWAFTAEPGATIECRLQRRGNPVFDWAACTSPKTYSLRDQDDAIYRLLVRARDAAGNVSANASDDYELDSTDPTPPSIDTAPQNTNGDATPTWKFSGEDGAAYECALDRGSDSIEKRAACTSPMTYKLTGLQPGVYTFSVWATDQAGNTSRVRTDQFTVTAAATGTDSAAPGSSTSPGSTPTDPTPGAAPAPSAPGSAANPKSTAKPGKGASKKPGATTNGAKPSGAPGAPGQAGSRSGAAGSTSGAGGSGSGHHEKKRSAAGAAAHAVTAALGKAAEVVTKNADKSVFPFSLVLIVFLFLGIQSRIDRSDPKLALAPLTADPDLEFLPPPTEA